MMSEKRRIIVACFCLAVALSPGNSHGQSSQMESAAVDAMTQAVQSAPNSDIDPILRQLRSVLLKVQKTLASSKLPPLKNVQISLQTGMKITVGGQITFFVFTIGDTGSNETAQTMKITLTPPKGTTAELESAFGQAPPNFSTQFSAAIIAAALATSKALAAQPAQQPLELQNLTASIKFTIENNIQGGVNTLTLLPVNLQASGKVTPTNTHEAILTFEKPGASGDGSGR